MVCDFSPLRVARSWVEGVANSLDKLEIPLVQVSTYLLCQKRLSERSLSKVDAHNVVPCWEASDKQEYAARTIRAKLTQKLATYLVEFPAVVEHPYQLTDDSYSPVDWERAFASLEVDCSTEPVSWAIPGSLAGMAVLEEFCRKRLALYSSKRNDPNEDALSNLSPWLHFGEARDYNNGGTVLACTQ